MEPPASTFRAPPLGPLAALGGAAPAPGVVPALDLVIRQSPVGIAVIDFDGRYREVNPAYCALYGYARDELLGRPFTMMFPPDQRDAVQARHQHFLSDGGELKGEWTVVRRDGATANVLTESVRLQADGVTHRLVYVVDISERKRMEQALQGSQQFLHSVLDGLQAHVCVLDETGVIVIVNRAWRDFAVANGGQDAAVLEGANYLAACQRAVAVPWLGGPEAGPFSAMLQAVLAGQRDYFQLEYACHAPGEQRWFVARVSCIDGSQPRRVVVAHDNVTALKQTQETLRRSEALLLDLAASMPGAMFRLVNLPSGQWRFTYVSPGVVDLFEVTSEQVCGANSTLSDCILPEDRAAHDGSIRAAVARGGTWEHEYRIRTRSGALKWIQARATPKPEPGEQGEVLWTGMLSDVSARKQAEADLRASEATYRTLFETVPQGVIYQDVAGRITAANPAAQRILGLTLDQMQGRHAVDPSWQAVREDGSELPGDQHPAMQALRTGQPVRDVLMGVSVAGRGQVWLLVNAIPLFKQGVLAEVYASFEDITERVRLGQELRRQASTDYLTGVANRRSLMERLAGEFQRVRRHPGQPCSVLALDLDLFKQVNDRWGHAVGDAALRHVAALMRQLTRQVDLVGRSGGEEFTLVLPDTGAEDALALAERLRGRIAQTPARLDDVAVTVTVSIGIGVIRADDPGVDAVLARADKALYEAKQAGRNTVRLFGPAG